MRRQGVHALSLWEALAGRKLPSPHPRSAQVGPLQSPQAKIALIFRRPIRSHANIRTEPQRPRNLSSLSTLPPLAPAAPSSREPCGQTKTARLQSYLANCVLSLTFTT